MYELLMFHCWRCGASDAQCLYCVTSVNIDPTTGVPVSVGWDDDGNQITITPSAEVLARASKQPLCDECVRSELGLELTAAARHERGCLGEA